MVIVTTVSAYWQERFVNKTTKISSNISKRNLPKFAHHPHKTPEAVLKQKRDTSLNDVAEA